MLAARPREMIPSVPGCQTARGICGSLVPFGQHRITLGAGLIFGFVALVLSFAAHAASPAETFIDDSIRKGSAILNSNPRDPGERDRAFRNFILSVTDMKRVALFTLGPYAKDAPEQALTDFVAAYTDLNVAL
jgi:ABC-type transporter MlaC component